MALIERMDKTTNATGWRGEIPLNYVYTAGRAGEVFFKAIKEKEQFIGTKCEKCGIVYLPPQIYCSRCFSRIENSYLSLGKTGTIHTFTISHETYDEKPKGSPSIVALIKIDGADGGIIHWIREIRPDECRIGMKVEAVFKPAKERKGEILDINYFKPVK